MTAENIAWVAGLFEGEGTFGIQNETSVKRINITSTDLDVLEKVQSIFGGKILKSKAKQPSHYKDKYNWVLGIKQSIDFVLLILPHLCKRRKERGEFYIRLAIKAQDKNEKMTSERTVRLKKILELDSQGYHHAAIAALVGLERSSVTKILLGFSAES